MLLAVFERPWSPTFWKCISVVSYMLYHAAMAKWLNVQFRHAKGDVDRTLYAFQTAPCIFIHVFSDVGGVTHAHLVGVF